MTLIFADGFEDGGVAWSISGDWAIVAGGRYGNGITGGPSGSALIGFPAIATPVICGFAFKTTSATPIMRFQDDGTLPNMQLSRGSGGEVTARVGATGSPIATSPINVLPSGAWSYIEARLLPANSGGSLKVKVNGVLVIDFTGDTQYVGSATTAIISLEANTATSFYDDFYIANTLGSYNNDFLGEIMVEHLRPNGDDTAQWVGSDGNSVDNYLLVDEAGTFNSTDYVASSTVGQRDLYTLASSARPSSSPVLGVIVSAVSQKTDVGTRLVKINLKEGSGGTIRQSAALGLPTTFGELRAVFERKNDGSLFNVVDVNSLRIGMEVST